MSHLAIRLFDVVLEDGAPRSLVSKLFPKDLPVTTLSFALNVVCIHFPMLHPDTMMVKQAFRKAKQVIKKFPTLTLDDCAIIVLYTMEDHPREDFFTMS